MKLPEHVDHIRILIYQSFNKLFSGLGIGAEKAIENDKIPAELNNKRQKIDRLLISHKDETGAYEPAREKTLEELTFTLFNRIAAVKVMEAHSLFPPVITKKSEHGDRSFGHKAWLEENPEKRNDELEGIREYIKFAFNQLGNDIPLYHKKYPYALLPGVIDLNEIIDAFNSVEQDIQIDDNIWQSDDVLGWLYESYNNKKKKEFKESNKKVEYDKVSLQSQIYTPSWVVKFLADNSLGKLYLEMYPGSEIKEKYKIANAPETRKREIKPLHDIKLIDPAQGSGNFLLYAFDLFYDLYTDQIDNYDAEYNENDIPRLIIENNLHGIDLDNRAVQLAQLGLYIKAKRKRRNLHSIHFNVVSSDFFLPGYDTVRHIFEMGSNLDSIQKEIIEDIWENLQNAYKYGSLIKVEEKLSIQLHGLIEEWQSTQLRFFDENTLANYEQFKTDFFSGLEKAVEQYAENNNNLFLTGKTKDAITFLKLLNNKYDVAVTNPPYTDSADYGPKLKKFVEANYKKPFKFHSNLYASFIKRNNELTNETGKIAMIHPHTFMFIKTFEDVRKFMIDKTHIDLMVDYGLDRVNLFGPGILLDATFYVLSKNTNKHSGIYFNITKNLQEKYKKEKFLKAFDNYIEGIGNERVYMLKQPKLKIIKSWPFIYWISDEFREKFKLSSIEKVCPPKSGLATANNNRFLKFWWELMNSSLSKKIGDKQPWIRYNKGGPYRKWYGNLWLRINWKNNAQVLRDTGRAVFRNEEYYFLEGITYSASGSKSTSFRYLPPNCVYDVGGASLFPKNKTSKMIFLALLNSKITSYLINCLNPTVNTQVGDIERIPFVVPDKIKLEIIDFLSERNINISKFIISYSIVEDEFKINPFEIFSELSLEKRTKLFFDFENHLNTQIILNEAIINEKIFEVYDLTEHDKEMVIASEGRSIGSLPVENEARNAYLEDQQAPEEFPLESIKDYISGIETKEFSEEEKQQIIGKFPTLYKKNNDLEEFCIRHQVNPINVWYWFKKSNVIPKQRMNNLAMEFLVVMIREILMEDEDGIIPIVHNAGEKVLLDRIEKKFYEKGFSTAQYSSFSNVLGRELNDYINNYFFKAFSDYLNLFMYLPKTPFIWHLSSGKEQGFDAYIIIYKWNKDKFFRIKSIYIENRERALINRQTDLTKDSSAKAQNEKDKIHKQLKEIEVFKKKIDELLEEGYDPVLDDGVGKNIAPLQNKGMLAYDVLNKGQLKKYLEADW